LDIQACLEDGLCVCLRLRLGVAGEHHHRRDVLLVRAAELDHLRRLVVEVVLLLRHSEAALPEHADHLRRVAEVLRGGEVPDHAEAVALELAEGPRERRGILHVVDGLEPRLERLRTVLLDGVLIHA
jgi:hypothetical protein